MADWQELDRDQLERHLEHELKKRGMTRRELVKGGAGLASAVGLSWLFAACGDGGGQGATTVADGEGAATSAATLAPPKFTGTLRVIGLPVDLIDPIRTAGEKALGFKLAFNITDSVTMVQKAKTQPGSFDVLSGYTYQYNEMWPSGNLIPQDISKFEYWSQVSPLINKGKVDPTSTTCTYGDGDAPFRSYYVDVDKLGKWPSSPDTPQELQGVLVSWVDEKTGQTVGQEPTHTIGPPNNFNVESMGYNADVINKPPEEVDWPELFNRAYKGRVAILNDPGVGLQDAGAAAQTMGLMTFGDLGDMTREEIDGLIKILLHYKQKGQFRGFWTTFTDSANFMASGEVVIEGSMWAQAVALLVVKGMNVRYAAPPSGFRGWCSTQGIAKVAAGDASRLQACYDYINWWHSGEPGAIMIRQGYYNAVQETSRRYLEPAEWDFWIEGKPAAKDLPGILGKVGDIKKGHVRDGGSFAQRACRFTSWNSYFSETEYQVQRWNEFLNA